MQYQINFKRYALIVASTVLLSACQSETSTSSSVKFSPPDRIVQVRAIDLTLVRPVVQLGDGTLITMQPGEDNTWSGSIRVQPNQSYQLMVNWIETLPQGDLPLAQWASSIDVDEDGEDVIVSAELYDYSADFDGDSATNIEEREEGTDPFDPTNGTGSDTQGDSSAGGTDGGADTTSGVTTGASSAGSTDGDTTTSGDTAGNTDGDTITSGDTAGNTDGDTAGNTDGDTTTSGDTAGNTDGDTTTSGDTAGNTDGDTGATGGDTTGGSVHSKASVLIPRIAASAAPTIDGDGVTADSDGNLTGEWASAVEVDDSGSTLWIKNLMIDDGADGDNGAELRRWAAMHDGETLYLLVLSDDLNQTTSDSIQPWNDDSIEIFIDGDNSSFTEYGDADDYHIILPLHPLNADTSNNELTGRSQFGPMSSQEELDYEFSTGIGNGPDGPRNPIFEFDVYEVAIPLDDANIALGFPVGLELQLNDDDDGDQRDSKWGWFHLPFTETDNPDESYTNPSIMGTVVLEE